MSISTVIANIIQSAQYPTIKMGIRLSKENVALLAHGMFVDGWIETEDILNEILESVESLEPGDSIIVNNYPEVEFYTSAEPYVSLKRLRVGKEDSSNTILNGVQMCVLIV